MLGATPCSGVFAAAGLSCRRARRGAGWRPPKAGDVLVGELPPLPHRATSCAEAAATPWSSVAGAQAAGLSALCVHATAAAVRWFHVLPRVGGVRSGGSGPPAVCVSRRRQWGSPPPSWMRSLCVEPGRGDDAFAVPPGHAVLRCPSGERGDARGHPLWTTGRGHTLVRGYNTRTHARTSIVASHDAPRPHVPAPHSRPTTAGCGARGAPPSRVRRRRRGTHPVPPRGGHPLLAPCYRLPPPPLAAR